MSEIQKKNTQVIAFGCRLNIFESELIKDKIKEVDLDNVIVVNTCTVTDEARKQSMKAVRKLKRQNPNSKIIVTGCGAEIDKLAYENMEEVDKIVGNKDKFNIESFIIPEKVVVNDINDETNKDYILPIIEGFENRTRAFIQIQQGCDHRCSFCIIYKARGKSKSVSEKNIIEQIQKVVDFGHKEVVLTGVDISSWQRSALLNEPSKIGELCINILDKIPSLERLRLSSLDPAVEDENILHLLKNNPRFMPHLHLSLQAMSDNVLRNMGRRHSKASATAWIEKIREANPNVVLGADIICGFPKETELQHIETLNALVDLNIPMLHVFPYSERLGTAAANMKPLSMDLRRKRANHLINISYTLKENLFKSKVGKKCLVLVEAKNTGYTEDYCMVDIVSNIIEPNKIIEVEITGYNKKGLIGKVLS